MEIPAQNPVRRPEEQGLGLPGALSNEGLLFHRWINPAWAAEGCLPETRGKGEVRSYLLYQG